MKSSVPFDEVDVGASMRAVFLIVPVLLVWFWESAFVLLGGLYLAGALWLAFEYWRAPLVDEHGAILAAAIEHKKSPVAAGSGAGRSN